MTSHALARTQNVQVETLPAATAMDVLKKHPSPITQYLVEQRGLIEPLLPDGVKFLGVVWELVGALEKDRSAGGALAKCTPASVFLGVAKIQTWGLEIGRTAHLVPFGQVCTPLIDYKGEIQLAKDARVISHATADPVYEHDLFEYERGMHPKCRHVPKLDPKQRGRVLGAVAILHLPTREKVPYFMPIEEIDAIRQKHSKQWKNGACPDWYMRKTVIRQALKLMPKTSRLDQLLTRLEQLEGAELPHAGEISATMVDAPEFTDGTEVDVDTGEITNPRMPSIAEAKAVPFPFQKGKPLHGRPLGELETDMLTKVAHWIVDQQEAKGDPQFHLETLNAINVIVDDREQPQSSDVPPADEPDLGLDDQPKGAPAGSLSVKMPPGGKQEDAFKKPLGTDALRAG